MARCNLAGVALALVVAAAAVVSLVGAQCNGDVGVLTRVCYEYVKKDGPAEEPSGECCSALQHADLRCVCGYLTPPVMNIISMSKVRHVAARCRVSLPPHCGPAGRKVVHG